MSSWLGEANLLALHGRGILYENSAWICGEWRRILLSGINVWTKEGMSSSSY